MFASLFVGAISGDTLFMKRVSQNILITLSVSSSVCVGTTLYSLRCCGPKTSVSVPLFVPLFTWFSGPTGVLRDTERHKNHRVFIDVYEFAQENGKLKTAPEACKHDSLRFSNTLFDES